MDTLTLTDINRMILSIEHESNSKSKEVKLEAVQEYNLLKLQNLEQGRIKLLNSFNEKLEELERLKIKNESILKREFKIKSQKLKEDLIERIFTKTYSKLENTTLKTVLLDEVISKIDIKNNFSIFCNKKDTEIIQSYMKIKNIRISFTIHDLPNNDRGVLICDKNGREFYDNTYKTRLDQLKNRFLNVIVKEIFKN